MIPRMSHNQNNERFGDEKKISNVNSLIQFNGVCFNQQHGQTNDTATLYDIAHKNNNKTALNLQIL